MGRAGLLQRGIIKLKSLPRKGTLSYPGILSHIEPAVRPSPVRRSVSFQALVQVRLAWQWHWQLHTAARERRSALVQRKIVVMPLAGRLLALLALLPCCPVPLPPCCCSQPTVTSAEKAVIVILRHALARLT